jgi:long-chain acyl-CoA synthetase
MTATRRTGSRSTGSRAAKRQHASAGESARPWVASYDPGVSPEIDIPDITVDVLVRQAAELYPSRPALLFFGRQTTFAEVDRAVDAFASYLHTVGLGKGDVVSLHLPTSPAFVIAFLGTLRAGCIVSPMSPLLVERELEILLRETKPRVSVVLDVLLPRVAGVRSRLGDSLRAPGGMQGIVVTGIQDSLPAPIRWLYPIKARREGRWNPVRHSAETPNLFRVIRETPPGRVESGSHADEPAALQCTGGTTGIPKAAVLTHRNLVANAAQCASVLAANRDDASTVLCALPYFHIYGLTVAMNFSLMLGLTQILHPRFEPEAVLKSIDRFKPRFFPGAPIFYARLLDDPQLGRYDLRSIEACISGAAPLPQSVQERFEAITGGRLCEGYGLTEASPVTHVNPIHGRGKPGSIGLPMPSTDARIVDLDSGARVLEPGEIGELCVRGPQVMAGYYERPNETAQVIVDGWLHTGDVATMDADGYFTIVDRLKDVIIVSGANVYPTEVEDVLAAHPGVAEAAVIGIPDDHKGEVAKAYVVLDAGSTTTVAELHAYCAQNLSSYKRPVDIEVRTELPKTMIGKVLRRELEREHEETAAPAEPSL